MQKFGVFRWHYYSKNFADTEFNSLYRFEKGSGMIGRKKNFVKENMEYVIGEHILKTRHVTIKCC